MRDILVMLIFVSGTILAFKRPYIAVLLWVWISVMNPHRLGWGFAYSLPFAMAAAGILVMSMLFNSSKVRWNFTFPMHLLLALIAWMSVTTAFSIVGDESISRYVKVLKVLLVLIPFAAVVRTRQQIFELVVLLTGSLSFFGIKGGIFTILSGGGARVWGPDSSVIEGNNELAVALIMTVPLLYFLGTQISLLQTLPVISKIPEKWLKRFLNMSMFLSLVAALGSHSRGALLAMIAMGGVLWWRSKSKVYLLAVAIIVTLMAVMFMPGEWSSRMGTIQTYEQDGSAMGRINAWTMAYNIANDRITGAGFVTDDRLVFQQYAPDPRIILVAHSVYFQILGEHGYIGLLLYLSFWISTYRLAGRIIKQAIGFDDLAWASSLANMIKASLLGFAVGGAFLSLAYWDAPFYLFLILICTDKHVKEELSLKTITSAKSRKAKTTTAHPVSSVRQSITTS